MNESKKPVTDTWITTKVKADLLATDNVAGTDVKVETKNGIVTLTGAVATQAEHDKAVAVAKGIEGVKSVKSTGLKVTAAKKVNAAAANAGSAEARRRTRAQGALYGVRLFSS